ncbi:unnamed protein product [Clonostachys rhizophaga]|uniref:Uncharacterized protein n=1 Tax=Clonostachys rhizophaga TaxID=160324 RepID=A0A9N9YKS5_9HYPO|nr:unnamed protein product [Clonostachys rhizophaga]
MGRPTPATGSYRDDPDAVSLRTEPGDAYVDDVPEIASAPPAYVEATGEGDALIDGFDDGAGPGGLILKNGTTPAESHQEGTSSHIFAKRTRITNEVNSLQDDRSDGDPEFLERWVRHMASKAPSPYIHITGNHRETKRDMNGKSKTETVEDFRILVSLQNYLWPNFNPRGEQVMNFDTVDNGESTFRGTVFKKRAPGSKGNIEVGTDKPSLEEWCHRYCAKAKSTRCFRLTRTVTGLDEQLFRSRLEGLIRGTNYKGKLSIEFPVADRAVDIYSTTWMNNWRTTDWIRWIFYLTFLWIFSWPILYFTTKKYYVVRAEWPFAKVNPQGRKTYTTVSEEQWIENFGPAVQQLCLDRYQGLTGDDHLKQILARPATQSSAAADFRNARAALNVATSAASVLRGGPVNAISQVSNIMRLSSGTNDQVGWGFDT